MIARRVLAVGLAAALGLARAQAQNTLPVALSDKEFWALSEEISEPGGTFSSDNLVSNETNLSSVAAELAGKVKPGGVYLGVGPEQNFTYIAATRPRLAFVTDIRRGNLPLQLMYKALFELSADRAEFVSRLLTKPRPSGLTEKSTAADLMNAYWDLQSSGDDAFRANLDAIKDVLVKRHGFRLSLEDLDGVAAVYTAFYLHGPRITYGSRLTRVAPRGATFADLMMTVDRVTGFERSFLSTEEGFAFLKTFQAKNLLVPVVGDFAGPKALRSIGQYVRRHGAVVSAFYLSNVEDYLIRGGLWPQFCRNAAALPVDDASLFIRPLPIRVSFPGFVTIPAPPADIPGPLYRGGTSQPFAAIAPEVAECAIK